MNDLTILYYTANMIPEKFMKNIQNEIVKVAPDTSIISVSQKPIDFGKNICIGEVGRSLYNLYYQVLVGVREVKTKYVAIAEDDTLYPPEHFAYRPPDNTLNYDTNKWSIFAFEKNPIFCKRLGRKTMDSLVSTTDTLLNSLEERYKKYPTVESIPAELYQYYWGEPGRFENHLMLPKLNVEKVETVIPHITFYTPECLGFSHLGKRKAHGELQADELPFWGKASEVIKLYE